MPENPQPFNLDSFENLLTLRAHPKGGRVFDRLLLQKLLGRGGMGVVWLAMDDRLGREFALKFARAPASTRSPAPPSSALSGLGKSRSFSRTFHLPNPPPVAKILERD